MTQAPPLTLDAITRAVAILRPDDAARADLAAALRIVAPAEAAQDAAVAIAAPAGDETETIGVAVPMVERPPVRSRDQPPRVTRLYALPDTRPRDVPDWFHRTTPMALGRTRPKAGEDARASGISVLTPRQTARGLIKAMLSVPTPSGPVDIAATVERLARGDPIVRLPLRPARGLSRGAALVIDTGAWLDPFRRDAIALLKAVRNLLGADRVSMIRTDSEPPPLVDAGAGGDGAEGAGGLKLRPGIPVLVISDFGLSPGRDLPARTGPAGWARFGDAVRAGGGEPIGLLPFPDSLWPAELSRAYALLHWTVGTTARAARRARERGGGKPGPAAAPGPDPEAGLATLQMACAVAGRVDPEMMRALRLELLPDSSPGLEADLWWGEDVGSRGAAAITLAPEALGRHRLGLRDESDLAGRAIDIVRRLRAGAAPMLRMEEEIVGLALQRPAGWQDRIVGHLQALLKSLLQNPSDPPREVLDAARYLLAGFPDLDLPPEARPLARDLAFAADQLLGAVSPAGDESQAAMSPWIADMMQPTIAPAGSPISVTWEERGLSLEPGEYGEHVIQVGGPYPTLSVEWPGEQGATGWMAMDRPHIAPAPPADHAELRTRDGSHWIIEDADAADALRPLRLFALVHPESRDERVETWLTQIEITARRRCGLPPTAPVLLRNFLIEGWNELPSWRDRPRLTGGISTWRGAVAKAVESATAFLIVVTEPMLREDWTSEVLKAIAERTGRGPHQARPIVLAVEWGGQSKLNPMKFLDHHKLDHVAWMESPNDAPGPIGAALASAWRSGPKAADDRRQIASAFAGERQTIRTVIDALQGLVGTFHVRRVGSESAFGPSGDPDPRIWGFANTSTWAEASLATSDFELVRTLAEYIYDGPVRDYLQGHDPFAPKYDLPAIRNAAEKGPPFVPAYGATVAVPLDDILKRFHRFATKRDRRIFDTTFDPGQLGAMPGYGPISTDNALRLAELIHPYSSQFNEWRMSHDFSFNDCRTFPEFMEAYSGLLQHYLRSLAREMPETEVELTFAQWQENWEQIRSMFPASFEYLNMRDRAREPASPERMPIIEYADLVANLSDVLAFAIRGRVATAVSPEGAAEGSPYVEQ